MLGGDEQMQTGFVHFQDFTQGFGFASRDAIFEARELYKTHPVGFHLACEKGVACHILTTQPNKGRKGSWLNYTEVQALLYLLHDLSTGTEGGQKDLLPEKLAFSKRHNPKKNIILKWNKFERYNQPRSYTFVYCKWKYNTSFSIMILKSKHFRESLTTRRTIWVKYTLCLKLYDLFQFLQPRIQKKNAPCLTNRSSCSRDPIY